MNIGQELYGFGLEPFLTTTICFFMAVPFEKSELMDPVAYRRCSSGMSTSQGRTVSFFLSVPFLPFVIAFLLSALA